MILQYVMVMTGGYASSWLILHVGMLFGQGAKNAASLDRIKEARCWDIAYYLCVILTFLCVILTFLCVIAGSLGLMLLFKELIID